MSSPRLPRRLGLVGGLGLAVATLLGPLLTDSARAEPGELIHIFVGADGTATLPLALPTTKGGDRAAEFWEVVRRDLELTGWFEIIDPAAYIESSSAGLEPGQFSFEDWSVPGAVGLAKTGLEVSGGQLRTEVWVYDVPGQRKLQAKAFSGAESQWRTLAHKTAWQIAYAITGKSAPFNTRFAVAGKGSGNKEIYVVDFDGNGLTRVTRNGSINLQPAWSPGGDKIAFTSYVAGNPDVYIADLVKGRITRLSARPGLNTGPSWHPGKALLALTLSVAGDSEIFTVDATSGARVQRLTTSPGIDVSPAISPDGSRVAFVSERSGGAQIYVMGIDGGGARRVTFQGSHNTDPDWSPDGRSLAFVSRRGVFDVFTVRADGTGIKAITQAAGDNEDPTWSPDGNFLAFSSTRSGSAQIWISTENGAHQAQVTQGKGGLTNPDWSPPLPW